MGLSPPIEEYRNVLINFFELHLHLQYQTLNYFIDAHSINKIRGKDLSKTLIQSEWED
jgi:hypothetical protein